MNSRHPSDHEMKALSATYRIGQGYERIYFIHARKTGGTSLNHAFYSLSGFDPSLVHDEVRTAPGRVLQCGGLVYVADNLDLINRGHYFYGSSHIPKHRLCLPNNTFTITILRDPVERVLSHYRMLLHYRLNGIRKPFMAVEEPWLGDNSFSHFIRHIPHERLANQLYMFSERFDIQEALDNILSCDSFFFLNDFVAGVTGISNAINIPLEVLHVRKNTLLAEALDSDFAFLREKLEPEYRLLEHLIKNSPSLASS